VSDSVTVRVLRPGRRRSVGLRHRSGFSTWAGAAVSDSPVSATPESAAPACRLRKRRFQRTDDAAGLFRLVIAGGHGFGQFLKALIDPHIVYPADISLRLLSWTWMAFSSNG